MLTKEFQGTFTFTGNKEHEPSLSGQLSWDKNLLKGSLKLGDTEYYIPIDLQLNVLNIISKSITFIIPNDLLEEEDISGTETFITITVSGSINQIFTKVNLLITGTLFGLVNTLIAGTIDLDEVSSGSPTSYTNESILSFSEETISPLTTVSVNQKYNTFDNFGLLLGLPRLSGESNADYYLRLIDVYTSRANSSYRGLVNGITRELGLLSSPGVFDAIQIDSKGGYSALDECEPVITIIGSFLFLFTVKRDNKYLSLDSYYNLRSPSLLTIKKLSDDINSNSQNFSATILTSNTELWSRCLLRCSNLTTAIESLPNMTNIKLEHDCIRRSSVGFSDNETFHQEVEEADQVDDNGKYFINYEDGNIISFNLPRLGASIRYIYTTFPYILQVSQIAITDLKHPWTQQALYEKMENETFNNELDKFSPGLPSDEMLEYIGELLKVSNTYWG